VIAGSVARRFVGTVMTMPSTVIVPPLNGSVPEASDKLELVSLRELK
jgi:hypothetical protein